MVHYVSHGTPIREDGTQAFPEICRAAVVTEVNGPGVASLCVLNPTGFFFHQDLPYDDTKSSGSWHWPCVIEE